MKESPEILVIGGGKMGEGILAGWLSSNEEPARAIAPASIRVVEPTADRRAYLAGEYGVDCLADVADAAPADVVIFAVKPQVMMDMLAALRANAAFDSARLEDVLFVSIAAGLTTAKLESALKPGSALVRVMPNMPLSIGAGASGVCGGAAATAEQVRYVADLFGCLGSAVVVDEADMDAVCALSGSGPAYVAALIESLRDAAVAEGLAPDVAEALALQTVLGTAQLIATTDLTPAAAREAVCSPGGTTLAALDAMNAAGFDDVFKAGISAAVKRSKELAQC